MTEGSMMKTKLVSVLALSLSLGLAACAGQTPYQPRSSEGGYSEQQLESDRYRVTFAGNTSTPRDVVENYLLYRAAELTVDHGYDWFDMAGRNTRQSSQTVTFTDPPQGFYQPVTRYYGPGDYRTYLVWTPIFGTGGYDRQTYVRFTASGEIVLHRGQKPEGDSLAFDAHQVMANLGPTLKRPVGG